jgi:ribosomal protein S18 acetylase RimI-like enzyme
MSQRTETTAIAIRAALHTVEDAAHFAELGNMASHDLMADLVGRNYRKIMASLFLKDDNLFGRVFSHFAVADGQTAGLLYSFSEKHKAALNSRTSRLMLQRMGLMLPRMLWVQARLQPLFDFMDALPMHAYYIQCLAVYPEFRGRGISKDLLKKADELARQAMCRTVELDTEITNTIAINAYRQHGMEITATSPTVYSRIQKREICLYRMVKTLAS